MDHCDGSGLDSGDVTIRVFESPKLSEQLHRGEGAAPTLIPLKKLSPRRQARKVSSFVIKQYCSFLAGFAPLRENNTTALAKGCRNKNQRGFTLLEIMVVVILVVLTVSLIGVNLGRDLDQIAQLEASRFARLVEHVRDQSILSGEVYAIEVDDRRKTYQFLQASRQWHPVTKDDVLRPRYFPDYLSVRFDILQRSETDQRMLLVVQGLGEITPFRLSVEGDKFVHVVTLDDSLNVKVDRVNRDAS